MKDKWKLLHWIKNSTESLETAKTGQIKKMKKMDKIHRCPKLDYYAIANFGGSSGAQ